MNFLWFIRFQLTDWFEDLFAWLNYLIPRPKSNLRNGSTDGFHVHLSSSLTCYDISLENFNKKFPKNCRFFHQKIAKNNPFEHFVQFRQKCVGGKRREVHLSFWLYLILLPFYSFLFILSLSSI